MVENGVDKVIYKYCCKCGKKIEYTQKMCDECTKKYGSLEKERYRRYQANRTDKESQVFYNSKEWKKVRERIKNRDKGLCLMCLYIDNVITSYDYVHHVEEEKERKDLRLEEDNLICLCKSCHKEVHKGYEKSLNNKTKMQNELKELIERSKLEFGK